MPDLSPIELVGVDRKEVEAVLEKMRIETNQEFEAIRKLIDKKQDIT